MKNPLIGAFGLLSFGILFVLILGFATSLVTIPESIPTAPKREMRGVWMSTVLNIDYPQIPTIDAATLQADFRSQLGRLKKIGVNAIFVQVRPTGDAIYPSKYAPWSQWISGRQGVAPSDGFDPLAFMVKEAQVKGIEFHAWINPYRLTVGLDTFSLANDHVFYQHRDWVRRYGDRLYLDPGVPQAQNYLLDIVEEVLMKYPINGLHFDDYFYPYPIQGEDFPDQQSFDLYGTRFETKAEWRRDNVNTFVRKVSQLIEEKKPWVKFGISPFGVWRNRSFDPINGSDTRAYASSYDDLYADALGWANAGIVDYLTPQLYWHIGYEVADYAHLLDWWSTHVHHKTKLYVGHAAYKVGTDRQTAWHSLEEIPKQISLNRKNSRVSGSVFFSAKSLLTSPIGLDARLKDLYTDIRLVPEQLDAVGPRPIAPKLVKVKNSERGPLLVWDVEKHLTDDQLPYYYSIYRKFAADEDWELIHVTPFGQNCRRLHFYDENLSGQTGLNPIYEVRAVDKYHRESTVLLP